MKNKRDVFYTGEDKLLNCFIKDSTGGAINLNTYSDIVVEVYSKTDKVHLVDFSKNPLTGFDSTNFTIVSAVLGNFSVKILASVSVAAVEDLYIIEIKTKEVAAGNFKTIFKEYLCEYQPAEAKTVLN